jgi:hypothetical protein
MAEATAAARQGRLPRVNLPAASPPLLIPIRRITGRGASRSMPATCRAPRRAVPLRRADACGALGREALDAGMVASGAGSSRASPAMPARGGGASIKARRARRGAPPRLPPTCRAPRRAVPLARTDAGGALGREALDCRRDGERRQDQAPSTQCGPWRVTQTRGHTGGRDRGHQNDPSPLREVY